MEDLKSKKIIKLHNTQVIQILFIRPVDQNYSTHCIERHVDECGNTDNEGLLTLRNISASEQGIYVYTSTIDNITSSEIRQIQIGGKKIIMIISKLFAQYFRASSD